MKRFVMPGILFVSFLLVVNFVYACAIVSEGFDIIGNDGATIGDEVPEGYVIIGVNAEKRTSGHDVLTDVYLKWAKISGTDSEGYLTIDYSNTGQTEGYGELLGQGPKLLEISDNKVFVGLAFKGSNDAAHIYAKVAKLKSDGTNLLMDPNTIEYMSESPYDWAEAILEDNLFGGGQYALEEGKIITGAWTTYGTPDGSITNVKLKVNSINPDEDCDGYCIGGGCGETSCVADNSGFCMVSPSGGDVYINRVTFNEIDQTSRLGEDFTETDKTFVEKGGSYNLTVWRTNILCISTWGIPVTAYFDWNGNGEFSSEEKKEVGKVACGSSSVMVDVPQSADDSKPLLMRVIAGTSLFTDPDYCGSCGEDCRVIQDVEEYSVCVKKEIKVIDCNDTNPDANPGRIEICGNGFDDDCDNLVDCGDSDCAADPACIGCVPTLKNCTDGLDNDCDNLVDCGDSDCAADPACIGSICIQDEDCGIDGFVGDPYCVGNNLTGNYIEFTCSGGNCSDSTSNQLIESCDYGCEAGACLEPSSDSYWANSAGNYIEKAGVVPGTTSLLLIWENTGLNSGDSVTFEVYEADLWPNPDDEILVGSEALTGTVDSEGNVQASWTPTSEELNRSGDSNRFYFEVNGGVEKSNELEIIISIINPCSNVSRCVDYGDSESSCIADTCNVSAVSVNANNLEVQCGLIDVLDGCLTETTSCSCEWDDGEETCGPTWNTEVEDDCDGPSKTSGGKCDYNESTTDTCDNDNFLDYSWEGIWIWSTDTYKLSYDPNDSDYVKDGSYWYYDPLNNFESCSDGSNIVPCPQQVKLPFFGLFGFLMSFVLIGIIYFVFRKQDL